MGLSVTPGSTRIYGHRGSRLRCADNTIASFRLALDEGAHGFETDVRCLADGTLVLFHADFVGQTPTETLTFEELSRHVSDLARPADLQSLTADAEKIFEMKGRGFEEQLVEQIQDLDSVVLCSFDHRTVRELARLRDTKSKSFKVGAILTGRLIDGAAYVRDLGAQWFLPASSFIDRETVEEFEEHRLEVVPWVLNHSFQWTAAHAWGCRGFITDDPLEASRWLASSGVERA